MAKSRKEATVDFSTRLMEKTLERTGQKDELALLGIDPVVGLSLDALSLQYLFGLDVCPIGKSYELVGLPGSCKSFFCHELGRWHVYGRTDIVPFDATQHTGYYVYNLAEPNRDQPHLRRSVTRHPLDCYQVFANTNHKYVEDWQDACTEVAKTFHETTGPNGKLVAQGDTPFIGCVAVDSFTGLQTRKEYDDTYESGHADPNYAHTAKSISAYLKSFMPMIGGWPISFVGTNHMKPKKEAGRIDYHVPGGYALEFCDSIRFRMQMLKPLDLVRSDGGRSVRFHTEKNSFTAAAGYRSLDVNVTWCGNGDEQLSTWQWHDATIHLLTKGLDDKSKRKVDKVLDLEIDANNRKVTSSTLGVKKVSYHEGGEAIMKDPALVRALQDIFFIGRRTPMLVGQTYAGRLIAERTRIFEESKLSKVAVPQEASEE